MKKLMFAAALAGAMTGLCDVSSANVVGYANVNKGEGEQYSMIGNIFQDIGGGETLDLNDLKGDYQYGDQLQLVKMVDSEEIFDFDIYNYYDADNLWESWLDEPGWADVDGYAPEGVGLDLGRGCYLITASGDGEDSRFSGQVKGLAHTHVFDDQYTIMGSAFPLTFDLNDARCDWAMPYAAQIQVVKMVDNDEIFDFDIYNYYDADNLWESWLDEPGWADVDGYAPEGPVVNAGNAFYLIFPDDATPGEWGMVETSPIGAADAAE